MAKEIEIEMDEMPEVDNVGIMQGFLEMMNEDDDLEEDDDEMEAGEMLGRTPDSPEILMNNLRGDMRSIDARRDELADLVGYSAAAETPEPVLAMLQPVLAQQGIGAMVPPGMGLPPGISPVNAPNAPNMPNVPNMPNIPSDMMAPMAPMPAGGIGDMAPPAPPPVQMARGGIVQRFRAGGEGRKDAGASGESDASSTDQFPIQYSPGLRAASDTLLQGLFTQRPEALPSLPTRAKTLSDEYAALLGSSKEATKSQALFDLASLGFSYAANIDPVTGKSMSGSPFARFAQAARAAPGILGKYAAEGRKEDRELKLLGLKGAQSEREAILDRNAKLLEEKRKAALKIAENQGKSRFSKSDFAYEILTTPNLVSDWATGKTDIEQNMLVESAITDLLKPITEDVFDPVNKTTIIGKRIRPGTLPPYVKDALTQWADLKGMSFQQAITLFTDPNAKGSGGTRSRLTPETTPPAGEVSAVSAVPPAPVAEAITGVTDIEGGEKVLVGQTFELISSNLPGDKLVGRLMQEGIVKQPPQGLFWQFGKLAGPASGIAAAITAIPGLGDPYPAITRARADAAAAQEGLVSAFIKSSNKPVSERKIIEDRYKVTPETFNDPYNYRNRLVAFDAEIGQTLKELQATSKNQQLSREQRIDADKRIQELQSIKRKLNVPIVVNTKEEEDALPEGTIYLWKGSTLSYIPFSQGAQ